MKALVKRHSTPGLWLEDIPEPEPGINDVLIKVHKSGICGTDLHIYHWDDLARKTIAIGWNPVIFNMLTFRGIYGREMYET